MDKQEMARARREMMVVAREVARVSGLRTHEVRSLNERFERAMREYRIAKARPAIENGHPAFPQQ